MTHIVPPGPHQYVEETRRRDVEEVTSPYHIQCVARLTFTIHQAGMCDTFHRVYR
jgi:hypothetical protein